LTVQKTISERLAHALTLKLTAEQRQHLKKDYTANAAAFQAYMKGRFFLAKRVPESIRQALGYFEKAIELDPAYALAYTGIADCYVALGTPQIMMGAQPQVEAFAKVRAAARKALELDATLAEAYASLGVGLLTEDDAAGHRELERALALNPNYVQAYNYYGTHLLGDGRPADALEKFNRALELDPLSILSNTNLGMALFRLRRYEEAVRQFKRTLEMDENYLRAHWGLGLAYEQMGRYDEARDEFQRLERLSNGGPLAVTALGHLDAVTGRRAEAEQRLARLLEMQGQGIVSGYYVAAIYVGLEDYEQAFVWLAKSKLPAASGLHKIDAYFDPIRNDPRFQRSFQSDFGQ
jgi:tetratricopeptide (TPR) repeat protein